MSGGAHTTRAMVLAALGFVALFAVAIAWAKWVPYWHKGHVVSETHSLGDSIVTDGRSRAPTFSWASSWEFARAYLTSIWPALLAALLIAAGIQTLIPLAHRDSSTS